MDNEEKEKNTQQEAQQGETVLADDKYDGFLPFANDGRKQDRYTHFRKGAVIRVQPDEYAIVQNDLAPARYKIQLLGPGFYWSNPLYEKFIYVPNPFGPVVIDFTPTSDRDKKENFTFTPNSASTRSDADQDEIYIDYKVEVRLLSPIKYYNSRNVIYNLKKSIVTVLKTYVSDKDRQTLFTSGNLDLEKVDPQGILKSYRTKYGLDVISLGINNVKLSESLQKAKNETAVSKEGIKKAKYDKKIAEINAEASIYGYKSILDLAAKRGLNNDQAVSLAGLYTNKEIAKNSNAHVFLNTANTGNASNQLDPNILYALYGGAAGRKFIQEEVEDDSEKEDVNVKKRIK